MVSWLLDVIENLRGYPNFHSKNNANRKNMNTALDCRESVAGFVFQATRMLKFEDGSRTGVLHGGFWCHCGDYITLGTILIPYRVLVLGAVQLSYGQLCLVSCIRNEAESLIAELSILFL